MKKFFIFLFEIIGLHCFVISLYSLFQTDPFLAQPLMANRFISYLWPYIIENERMNYIFFPMFLGSISFSISILLKNKFENFEKKFDLFYENKNYKKILKSKFNLFFIFLIPCLAILNPILNPEFDVLKRLLFLFMLLLMVFISKDFINNKNGQLKKIDFIYIFIFSILFFTTHIYQLDDPQRYLVGDSGIFFSFAKDILEGNINYHFFNLGGAYGQHPVSASVFQALVMMPFGISIFSWRLVGVISTFLMAIPAYLICKEIFSRKAGGVVLFLILFSHYWYIWAFAGYNNICGVFPLVYSVYFLIKYLKNNGLGYLVLCGMFSGFGWYLHSLSVLGIYALLGSVMFFSGRKFKEKIKICFIIGISCLITIWPLIGTVSIAENFHFLFKNSKVAVDTTPFIEKLLRQFSLAFVEAIYNVYNARSHWILGCATDVCSSFFMFIGIFVVAWKKKKEAPQNVLFGILFLLWIGICLSNPYNDFPNTRVLYLLIFWQIFASLGICFFIESIFKTKFLKNIACIFLLTLLFATNFSIGIINAFKFEPTSFDGDVARISKDFNVVNIYAIGDNRDNWILDIIFYRGYELKSNILFGKYEKIKIPNKIKENDIITVDVLSKDVIPELLNKYKYQNIQAVYRENRINKGKIIILANKNKIDEILDKSPASEYIAYKILS